MTNLQNESEIKNYPELVVQPSPLMLEFYEAAKDYISYIKNVRRYSPHTVSSYKYNIAQLGEYVCTLEITSINEISHKMLRNYIVELVEALYSPVSINQKIHSFSSFFRHCMRMGLIKHNRAKLLHQLKTMSKLTDYLTEAEMNKIYTEVKFSKNFSGIRNKYVIDLFYSSGIRLSELINLTENNIEGDMLKVIKGKGGYDRYIPLPAKFVEHHEQYIKAKKKFYKKYKIKHSAKEPLIINTRFQKSYPMLIHRIIETCFSYVKDKTVSPHVLRHSYATHLMLAGAPIHAIKDLLGHQTIVSTSRYLHLSIKKLSDVHTKCFPQKQEILTQKTA